MGSYSFPLPPRANQDTATFLRTDDTLIDPLANDSDSNGNALTLLSFDSASAFGAALTRSSGTGPGGRDQIRYTPPFVPNDGTDWFKYRIQDSTGMQAVGYIVVKPGTELVTPKAHWTLDESSGTVAVNRIDSNLNGTHVNGVLINQPGANSVTKKGVYYDGVDDYTVTPPMRINTNKMTFTGWIKRDGSQNPYAGLFSSVGYGPDTSFSFGTNNELRYTWQNTQSTWNSGLTVPNNEWCFVAMCASPDGVTLYLRTAAGLQSATNAVPTPVEGFNDVLNFGWDSVSNSRHFKGWLDDARLFTSTLSAANIESLYDQAVNPPLITLTVPANGSSVSPLNVNFNASVTTRADLVNSVDFVENEATFATAKAAPYQAKSAAIAPGSHTVRSRAAFGDWNYDIQSAPVTFTALPAPAPVITVSASSSASKLGPIPGSFTFTRNHPLGVTTVAFTRSGSAVAGTDYVAIPSSVTFPDGALTQKIVVNPIAAPPGGSPKTLVLTLGSGAGYTLGNPASATLTIDDHITSIASGSWINGSTWNSGAPAPTTGTQNSGPSYAIAHTVTSNDPSSGSQALVAGSLRVMSGGILDLARLHSYSSETANYNIPSTTVEDGGGIQFRASAGGSIHTLPAALTFAGSTKIEITGGSYDNNATLTGPIAGSGTISVVTDDYYVDPRKITVSSANNSFSGSWTLACINGGYTGLSTGAANALGTGFVIVGNHGQLINDAASGLNSLAGVTLNGMESSLLLNQAWDNPSASLDLSGGSPIVKLGNTSSSIGNLTGSAGSTSVIQGSGSSSALTVNQTVDGNYSGKLGTSLSFIKSGSAALRLSGPLDSGLKLSLAQGNLLFGSLPAGISSLNQTGGTLELTLPANGTAPLTLRGNLTRSAGVIRVNLPATVSYSTPYPIIAYQGTLSGTPAIEFSGPADATINYGTGSNSTITVIFRKLVQGVWKNDANGSWSNTANWSGGLVPQEAGSTANFATLNITGDRTVTLDTAATLGAMTFGDTSPSHNWILTPTSSGSLTMTALGGVPVITVNNQTATINASIAGTTGLIKAGSGTVALGASNSFTGGLTVNAGTVNLQPGDNRPALQNGNTVTVNNGGTVALVNTNVTTNGVGFVVNSGGSLNALSYHNHIQGLTLNGGTVNGIGSGKYNNEDFALDADLLVGGSIASTINMDNGIGIGNRSFNVPDATGDGRADLNVGGAGSIRGNGTLTKTGSGTLALTNNNAYTGGTNVAAGTLIVNNSSGSATGSGSVTVAAGADLGGGGVITGAVTANGTLSPGVLAIGSLTTGATTLASSSTLAWQVSNWNASAGIGYDQLVASSLNVTSTSASRATISVNSYGLTNFTDADKDFILVKTTSGITGFDPTKFTIDSSNFTAGTGSWSLAVSGNNLILQYRKSQSALKSSGNPSSSNALSFSPSTATS